MGLQPPHERQNRAFVGTPVKGPCFHPRAEAREKGRRASREGVQRSRFLGGLKAHLGMTMWSSFFWQLTTGCGNCFSRSNKVAIRVRPMVHPILKPFSIET
jgi:hypothetical protein